MSDTRIIPTYLTATPTSPRGGLRRRLLAAFMGLSALVLIAAVIAMLSLWMNRQSLEKISSKSIPIATTSLQLTRVAQQIVDTVPELVAATNATDQTALTASLGAHVEQLNVLLEKMRQYDVDIRAASSIERSANLFAGNIEAINRMVGTRIAVESDLQRAVEDALSAAARILDRIDQYTMDRSEGLARVLSADPTVLSQRLRLLQAHAQMREIELVLSSFDENTNTFLSSRARSSLDAIKATLDDVSPQDRGLLAQDHAVLETVFLGNNNITQLSSFQQQLSVAARLALDENADLASRFAAAIDRMLDVASGEVTEAKIAAADVQTTAFWLLLSVVLATLLSSYLIVRFYVYRNILARLTALTGAMMAIASGDLSARIPQASADELGSMAAALKVFRDTAVEVRDSNLREIQETRSRLHHAIENIQEGFALFDSDDTLTLANARFSKLLMGAENNLSSEDTYAKLIDSVASARVDPADAQEWLAKVHAYHRAPEGTLIWELADNAWLGATERPTDDGGRVMVVTDMTDIKRHEIELDELVAKLRKASAAKSSFIANVSHELRTPLTAVLGFAQIVQTRLENVIFPAISTDAPKTARAAAQIRENIDIMITEGQRLTKMINDILDLEKIEAGQMVWDTEPLDMGSVIRQAAAATNSLYTTKGLEFHIDVADELPMVSGDRNRLVQVIINLISNAVKFTERGHVACVARQGSGPFVSVSVSDTGIGIAPGDQKEVFDKFRQVGDTLTEKPSGTGLGLPICREIIEHLGGAITVESIPGYGSTFTFQLPMAETGAAAIQTERRPHEH